MNKYSQAFADAMNRTGLRNTVVAAHVGKVGNNSIAQWRTGRRPIPAEHAPKVASLLGVPPESISEAYERLLRSGAVLSGVTSAGSRDAPPARHAVLSPLEEFGRSEESGRIWMPDSIVKRKIGLTPIESIRWTLHPSWSMAPEIERHAFVLVDITVDCHEDVVDGGLYAYELWGRPDIRRILVRRSAWTLVGANSEVERITVTEQEFEHLRVFGAIIGWI
jgi:DNA-binding transcriptional regulator YdaS (Cro superfamily)